MTGEDALRARSSATHPIAETLRQLRAYFAGALRGSSCLSTCKERFSAARLAAAQTIPYGETRSYSQSRCCHRFAGRPGGGSGQWRESDSDRGPVPSCDRFRGKLMGYGGGLPLKKRLLELEGAGYQPLQREVAN